MGRERKEVKLSPEDRSKMYRLQEETISQRIREMELIMSRNLGKDIMPGSGSTARTTITTTRHND